MMNDGRGRGECQICGFYSEELMSLDLGREVRLVCESCMEEKMLEMYPEYGNEHEGRVMKRGNKMGEGR